ncbi:MAG: hypothetical protein AB4041_05840 [Microcystaceae cyanobacterium]
MDNDLILQGAFSKKEFSYAIHNIPLFFSPLYHQIFEYIDKSCAN